MITFAARIIIILLYKVHMKKLYSVVFAALMAVVSFSAHAETPYWEAVAGLNLSTIDRSGVDFRPGFHAGIRGTWDIPKVTDGFYVNAATLLSFRGFKMDSISYNPFFLDIPVHAGYKYAMDDRFSLFAEAGPYVGIGLFGKTEGYNVFSDEIGYKRLDVGFGLHVGIEFNNKVSVSLGGDFGFLKVADDFDYKPRNLKISVGYRL